MERRSSSRNRWRTRCPDRISRPGSWMRTALSRPARSSRARPASTTSRASPRSGTTAMKEGTRIDTGPQAAAGSRKTPSPGWFLLQSTRHLGVQMRFAPAVLTSVLCLAVPAAAQQGAAEVRGRVLDAHAGVLPGATIVLRNQATGMFRQSVSGPSGVYFLSGVTPGVYELSASLAGFRRYTRRGVRIEVGRTVDADVHLELGGMNEELTVTAETPIIDVSSKEVGGHITSGELTDLPSLNRSFIGFVALLPGMVPITGAGSF